MNATKIKLAIENSGQTLNSFATKNDIGYATLYDIVFGKTQNPRVKTIAKISNALGIPINEFICEEDNHEEGNT